MGSELYYILENSIWPQVTFESLFRKFSIFDVSRSGSGYFK